MTQLQPEGFLILTINNAQLTGRNLNEHGLLCLECITLPETPAYKSPEGQGDRDVWLVLRMNNYEMPISPLEPITHSRVNNTYLFPDHAGERVVLTLPTASELNQAADLETFQVLLEQYGVVRYESDNRNDASLVDKKGATAGSSSSDSKPEAGKLVLVDEEDGHIVGSLEEDIQLKEDSTLSEVGNEKAPVVINLPEEPGQPAFVSALKPEEVEGAFKAVELMSRGIIYATSAIASGMNSAATYYISHSTPKEKPVVFSEKTNRNLKRVHTISGTAFEVTSKTTKLIHDNIDWMISALSKKKETPQRPQVVSPPIPPRPGEKLAPSTGVAESSRSSTPAPKSRFINRLLISTDLLLTTLEKAGTGLLDSGTHSIARSLSHKYGQDTGDAALMVGKTAQNVGAVYIDARGIGRRALIRRAGKGVAKGIIGGRQVVFGAQQQAGQADDPNSQTGAGPRSSHSLATPSVSDYKPPLPPRKPSPAPPPYDPQPKEKKE